MAEPEKDRQPDDEVAGPDREVGELVGRLTAPGELEPAERRRLLGYWGTLEEAHEAALALLEQRTAQAIEGGGRPPSRQVPPQKPPSAPYPTGQPARPRLHSSRA